MTALTAELSAESESVTREKSPAPIAEKRYASRHILREEDRLAGPRQFHGGPEAFSPEFAVNAEVQYWLDRITNSERETGWILAALERSTPYADFIREKIEEYNLPPEIFYLPVVESMYKIHAASRSGAVGLWQFMRHSAVPWMTINEWLDERKDFWKSTVAAMAKLSDNYKVTGDWLLALAAYNCGLGKIQRIMKQSGLSDFWAISRRGLLPKETRSYIPQLIATARFASTLGRRGVQQTWQPAVRWRLVKPGQPVDLRLLAEAAGISRETLVTGNHELHYAITPPNRTYSLKVKDSDANKVEEALAKQDVKLMRYALHTIAAGHTLSEIAQHYGVPVSLLLKYNPGVKPEALRIGLKLVVPLYKDVGPYIKKVAPPPAAPAMNASHTDVSLFKNVYTVKKGDSLWSIARSFGTTSAILAAANGIPENGILRPGTNLKTP
jgi:membrane-bound lytic murein transglycosylase D